MSDNPFALSNIEPQQDSAPASDNPFALGAIQRDQRQDLRVNLESAVRTNPQQAAEAARLAKKYETPDEVLLRNLQDVKLSEHSGRKEKERYATLTGSRGTTRRVTWVSAPPKRTVRMP